jgi:hypothetical protein
MHLKLSSSVDYLEASRQVQKWTVPKNSNRWLGTLLVKAIQRITKPIYPFNMNPTLDLDSDIGLFTVDEAEVVARQREIKESVAGGEGFYLVMAKG